MSTVVDSRSDVPSAVIDGLRSMIGPNAFDECFAGAIFEMGPPRRVTLAQKKFEASVRSRYLAAIASALDGEVVLTVVRCDALRHCRAARGDGG